MNAIFDHMAPTYDAVFTQSNIGRLQRNSVWNYLESMLDSLPGKEVLELNGGTGEDAGRFAERGYTILSTDLSPEMVSITQQKANALAQHEKLRTTILDLNSFTSFSFDRKYDLVFSNFGGLNCISPTSLKRFLSALPEILNPGGRFVGIIMPNHCLWETSYFLMKLKFRKAFRRWTNHEVTAQLEGIPSPTWYYNPSFILSHKPDRLQVMTIKPVGFALPPSYLEKFFSDKHQWLLRLNEIEHKTNKWSWLASFSDHYLVDLSVR